MATYLCASTVEPCCSESYAESRLRHLLSPHIDPGPKIVQSDQRSCSHLKDLGATPSGDLGVQHRPRNTDQCSRLRYANTQRSKVVLSFFVYHPLSNWENFLFAAGEADESGAFATIRA